MIFWPLVALVTVLLLVGTVRYGQPALEHRKHGKALANIARLESELGIGYRPADDFPVALAIERAWAERGRQVPEPTKRVIGKCDFCHRTVALNAGACGIPYYQLRQCAKEQYRAKLIEG